MPEQAAPESLGPSAALQRLADGNRRFRERGGAAPDRVWDREAASEAQRPFAIILGCSDSRIPVEIVFDAGFGELFVVRVAGNVVAPSVVGSIEFAASQFGSRLVVVMGHTGCGAIAATLGSLATGRDHRSRNIRSITDRIAPHVEDLARAGGRDVEHQAMRANVRASVDHLRHGSPLLEELVLGGQVAIVGAEYELETGTVNFFETLGN